MPLRVELDVFSGKPNPHWDLSPQEEREFLELFEKLAQGSPEGRVREDLGYRGLIVTAEENEIRGCDRLVVSNGIVLAVRSGKSQQLADQGRILELWLAQKARGHVPDELYGLVLSEIESGRD